MEEDGETARLLGARVADIPTLLSVLALVSFAASVIYNAGFEAALGLEPGHVPVTLADYTESTLLWLPSVAIAGLLVASFQLAGRRLGMKSDEEVIATSKNPAAMAAIVNVIHFLTPWCLLALGVYTLLSEGETRLGLFIGACASVWMLFASWALRRETPASARLWHVFVVAPAVSILLFGFGWSAAVSALRSTPDDLVGTAADTATPRQVTMLRVYETGALYRDQDRIVFSRWDAISAIRIRGRTEPWYGVRCTLSGCRANRTAPNTANNSPQ